MMDPINPARDTIMHSQLTQATLRIREMILRQQLGPGERVTEARLAAMLGMSRTPVRQALPLLAQEGLLTRQPTRGYVVRHFTASDVADAIEIRSVLEGMAVRLVAEKGASSECLETLRACLAEGDAILCKRCVGLDDEVRYAQMNARFHQTIINEACSPVLEEALERNNRVPFAGAHAIAFERENPGQVYAMLWHAHQQHHTIVECIERGHSARAESLMREHAFAVKDSINLADGAGSNSLPWLAPFLMTAENPRHEPASP